MKKNTVEDQISARFPDLLMEEVADVIERMEIYRETIAEAVVSLRKNGMLIK